MPLHSFLRTNSTGLQCGPYWRIESLGPCRWWLRRGRHFSGVKEIPVEEMTWPTYSTSSSPSLVFFGLTKTLNSLSLEKTLWTFARKVAGSPPRGWRRCLCTALRCGRRSLSRPCSTCCVGSRGLSQERTQHSQRLEDSINDRVL